MCEAYVSNEFETFSPYLLDQVGSNLSKFLRRRYLPLWSRKHRPSVVPCLMARKAGTGFGDIVGSGVNKRLGSTG